MLISSINRLLKPLIWTFPALPPDVIVLTVSPDRLLPASNFTFPPFPDPPWVETENEFRKEESPEITPLRALKLRLPPLPESPESEFEEGKKSDPDFNPERDNDVKSRSELVREIFPKLVVMKIFPPLPALLEDRFAPEENAESDTANETDDEDRFELTRETLPELVAKEIVPPSPELPEDRFDSEDDSDSDAGFGITAEYELDDRSESTREIFPEFVVKEIAPPFPEAPEYKSGGEDEDKKTNDSEVVNKFEFIRERLPELVDKEIRPPPPPLSENNSE
jgi:hypothetical protein